MALLHPLLGAFKQTLGDGIDLVAVVGHDGQIDLDFRLSSGWTDDELEVVLQPVFQHIGGRQVEGAFGAGSKVNPLGGLVVGYIFSFIFTYILPAIGSVCHISFLENSILASEKYAWIAVLIVGVWQAVAMNTIIYISGLQTVPEDVYEASMLDGANKWTEFWKITFPLIMPFVSINLVLSTKNFLMVFDQIVSLTQGGPAQSTESISYLIYKNGMSGGQFGFQSANAVLFFIVIVAISVFQLRFTNKKEEQL